MKKKSIKSKAIVIMSLLLLTTGCTKTLTDNEKKPVKNETTGQTLTAGHLWFCGQFSVLIVKILGIVNSLKFLGIIIYATLNLKCFNFYFICLAKNNCYINCILLSFYTI